ITRREVRTILDILSIVITAIHMVSLYMVSRLQIPHRISAHQTTWDLLDLGIYV
ncbi:hypothetical protein CEXT_122681, partial [Caerostris extrusa]